jgi:putative glutamine amidotransferase
VHHLDGIVLTGGADVEPSRYGHDNHASDTEPDRDEVEFTLFETALGDGLPVLGICRGLQLINVHQGGTLQQHVPEHSRYDIAPHEESHVLTITPGSTLHRLYGDTARVNSLHHQTVDAVGRGLTVTAVAEDGTVEGCRDGRDAGGGRPVAPGDDGPRRPELHVARRSSPAYG